MTRPRILAMVLAGGQGSRLDALTRERPKPVLPFGGTHRLIDIPLSNLVHSDITDVLVCVQYHAGDIERAVAGGRPWDLDRTRGGLLVLGPEQGRGEERSGFAQGNADLLRRMRHEIRQADPDALLVLSADHVYRTDFRELIATHLEAKAACTMLTYDLSKTEAVHHAVVQTASDEPGAVVTGFDYKPSSPTSSLVATEVFVYDPAILEQALGVLHAQHSSGDDNDTGLGDFGDVLIPYLMEHHTVVAHPLTGYWRDVGRPESFLRAHRDLINGRVDLFDDRDWPMLGYTTTRVAAQVRDGAELVDSLVSPGCDIAGRVVRSVLGPGVTVEAGAQVVDSVLFEDVTVRRDAFVGTAIVDHLVEFGAGSRVGVETGTRLPDPDAISIVGRQSVIAPRVQLPAGSYLEPGTTA